MIGRKEIFCFKCGFKKKNFLDIVLKPMGFRMVGPKELIFHEMPFRETLAIILDSARQLLVAFLQVSIITGRNDNHSVSLKLFYDLHEQVQIA